MWGNCLMLKAQQPNSDQQWIKGIAVRQMKKLEQILTKQHIKHAGTLDDNLLFWCASTFYIKALAAFFGTGGAIIDRIYEK